MIEILPEVDTVLVTGSTGFIGRALAKRLEAIGKNVLHASRSSAIEVGCNSLLGERIGHIFHLAGRIGVIGAWDDPVGYLETNAVGTARVLEQCRRRGCGMTFLSTYVYGIPERLPICETDPINPNNPYALSKHIAEQLCEFYSQFYDIPVVSLRLFNVYGPGQRDDFLVPFVIRQILDAGRSEIEVMDLTPCRDYVYLSDVIDAILLATRAAPGSIFNVGSGHAYSVEEIIRRASAAAGVYKPYRGRRSRRRGEIDKTVADTRALEAAVGWRPRVSIDSGLRQVVESMRGPCDKSM
jgi:nucleoside-diphosphate-sugar epimerase